MEKAFSWTARRVGRYGAVRSTWQKKGRRARSGAKRVKAPWRKRRDKWEASPGGEKKGKRKNAERSSAYRFQSHFHLFHQKIDLQSIRDKRDRAEEAEITQGMVWVESLVWVGGE